LGEIGLFGNSKEGFMSQVSDLDRLKAIHIAGTKGKGSTAAFCDSILSQYSLQQSPHIRPLKTGPTDKTLMC
jgi:folylpolyglutamate synthase/dihydropteroate synthase